MAGVIITSADLDCSKTACYAKPLSAWKGSIHVYGKDFAGRGHQNCMLIPSWNCHCVVRVAVPEGHVMRLWPTVLKGHKFHNCLEITPRLSHDPAPPKLAKDHVPILNTCATGLGANTSLKWNPRKLKPHMYSSVGATPVTFDFMLESPLRLFEFATILTFTIIKIPFVPDLRYVHDLKGSIASPGWDGITEFYYSFNALLEIPIPRGHYAVASLLHISDMRLDIFTDRTEKYDYFRLNPAAGPLVFQPGSKWLRVKVSRSQGLERVGFKLVFSFHARLTAWLGNGRWNCTSPEWRSALGDHFPCNLHAECVGGEDEDYCPYTTDRCGKDKLTIGHRCYIFTFEKDRKTWAETQDQCRISGAQLPSLSSYHIYKSVVRHVQKAHHYRPTFFVGMTPALGSRNYLYRHLWMYSDGTVAHYTGVMLPVASQYGPARPDAVMYDGFSHSLMKVKRHKISVSRSRNHPVHALCELPPLRRDTKIEENKRPTVVLPTINVQVWNKSLYIQCPAGHVTHRFLACDVHSACMSSNATLCPASKTSVAEESLDTVKSVSCTSGLVASTSHHLPASMFPCGNGLELVPYTLVCDHHQDCEDNSDEQFCQYTPCDNLLHFSCRNHQVKNLYVMSHAKKEHISGKVNTAAVTSGPSCDLSLDVIIAVRVVI